MEKTWTCPVCRSVFSFTVQGSEKVASSARDAAVWTKVCRSPEAPKGGPLTRCEEVRKALAALSGPEDPDL
jgi:hypothetical protein